MNIKKQWLVALIITSVFAVAVNTLLLGLLTERYFGTYLKESYELHLTQITDYLSVTMSSDYSAEQMENELQNHLSDPIISIRVYDASGDLISSVSTSAQTHMGMNGGMMGMNRNLTEETNTFDIVSGTEVIGSLVVTAYSNAQNSAVAWRFESNLIRNSLISVGIMLIVAIAGGMLISKKMSGDLIRTAQMAQTIEAGEDIPVTLAKSKEIRIIQQSLLSLRARLKLKQTSRKALADEMIHQSRTPLTILQTHLEAMEDGVIEMTKEEIKVCAEQIRSLTEIISNIGGLIDAGKTEEAPHAEEFEFGKMITQIVAGLKIQFDSKKIDLRIIPSAQGKTILFTDRYKLSQAIYNVLTNAYKFTDPGGHVTVSYRKEGSNLSISVKDDGIGIAQEDLGKIFEAYQKGSLAQTREGEGLGLYIAEENLRAIGGGIGAASQKGAGSTFVITLPLRCKVDI